MADSVGAASRREALASLLPRGDAKGERNHIPPLADVHLERAMSDDKPRDEMSPVSTLVIFHDFNPAKQSLSSYPGNRCWWVW
ncbi:hypothetical protein [Nostoc commune]|uniref:hypothetical protein n=1 Tax=Nostoc commune TaxID=1178 RepID=UPI0018C66FC1|nr:hypothetical protein [Nostoc commune]